MSKCTLQSLSVQRDRPDTKATYKNESQITVFLLAYFRLTPFLFLSLTAALEVLVYIVVQFFPSFKFYFPLFKTHYHTLPYPKTKENKNLNQGKKLNHNIHMHEATFVTSV